MFLKCWILSKPMLLPRVCKLKLLNSLQINISDRNHRPTKRTSMLMTLQLPVKHEFQFTSKKKNKLKNRKLNKHLSRYGWIHVCSPIVKTWMHSFWNSQSQNCNYNYFKILNKDGIALFSWTNTEKGRKQGITEMFLWFLRTTNDLKFEGDLVLRVSHEDLLSYIIKEQISSWY